MALLVKRHRLEDEEKTVKVTWKTVVVKMKRAMRRAL